MITHPATEQSILLDIQKRLSRLEDILIEKSPSKSDWITEKQAAEDFNYCLSSIRRMRRTGFFSRVKSSPSGRKIKLSRKELQSKLELKAV